MTGEEMMRRSEDQHEVEIDEYLWPLTGDMSPIDWPSLTEELQIRERLAEISAHVREAHVRPRLARLGVRVTSALTEAVAQGIVAGPEDGPPWAQTLREPVPRALRDEWSRLTSRLRELRTRG
jgi:hypothetical protein